jgi:hypothetical protein
MKCHGVAIEHKNNVCHSGPEFRVILDAEVSLKMVWFDQFGSPTRPYFFATERTGLN